MKEKIDLSLLRTKPDVIDVKLGEGGIREIEFFCQALQLIYGGKDPEVREKNTLRAIEKLRGKNLLPDKDASTLKEGYVFLRNLEHRIQIKDGRQTHSIPAKARELARLARMMGFSDKAGQSATDRFREDYGKKTQAVYSVYRSLFYRGEGALAEGVAREVLPALSPEVPEDEAVNILAGLGFKDAAGSLKTIRLLRDGPPFLHLGPRARVLLEKLAPLFLSKALASPDADMALKNIERFVSAAGARTGLYSLMAENPRLVGELMRIFGSSAFLSNSLIERPEDLDILFSTEMSRPRKNGTELTADLNAVLSSVPADDYEEKLDSIRRWRNREVFRIGLNDLLGRLRGEEASGEMTTLAEATLEAAYKLALQEVRKRYGQPGDERFFITGMGKLGAKELVYGSDLDIFFVYEDAGADSMTGGPARPAGGPRAVSTHEFFVHLAQRIISILTLRTKEGAVFSVDTRLRPSGSSGPLVVSRSSLLRYHAEKAGVWERQAAIKARAVAGDTGFGRRVLKELEGIVYSRPLAPDEISELLRIRKRMEEEIAKETPERFDMKAGRGGMVDIEFLAQALQLHYGWREPSIRTPRTLETLQRLSRNGMISPQDGAFLSETYGFYRQMETGLRIVHDSPSCVLKKGPTRSAGWPELDTLARRMAGRVGPPTGLAGLTGEKLLADYLKRRERVRELYLKVMEGLKS